MTLNEALAELGSSNKDAFCLVQDEIAEKLKKAGIDGKLDLDGIARSCPVAKWCQQKTNTKIFIGSLYAYSQGDLKMIALPLSIVRFVRLFDLNYFDEQLNHPKYSDWLSSIK